MNIEGNLKRGNNVVIAEDVQIKAKNIVLGDNVIIRKGVKINCLEDFTLGEYSILDEGVSISCNNFTAGKWLYTCKGFEVGRGGCFNKESNVHIGDHVGIFENVIINPNSEVYIGDNTGIGCEVMIWTHGAWLNPLEGYPKDFGPVKIGSNVWLPARCVVLPNVSIGDNTVIGINSLINKNIPSGVLAAGIPAKVIKENMYPKQLSQQEKNSIIENILTEWKNRIISKGIRNFYVSNNNSIVSLAFEDDITQFNLDKKTVEGGSNALSEDLRDFMRRNGIKIYTDKFFNSIK